MVDHAQILDSVRNATDLDDLLSAIAAAGAAEIDLENEGVDVTSLPVFGGSEPDDTDGVFSWDAERLLRQNVNGDFEIVVRS